MRELCLKYERIDPVHELIPVRPVVHYMMGGVHTDIDGATPLAGLYAAGEAACVSINGANRLGSNSLPELLVFGARAGRAAAEYAAARGRTAVRPSRRRRADEVRRLERDLLRTGPRHASASPTIRDEMQATMEEAAGIYRTGDSLAKGADKLRELQERVGERRPSRTAAARSTPSSSPRWSWPTCSTSAECIVAAGAAAARSRAARTSAPTSRPATTSGSSPTRWSHRNPDGSPRVEYLPVTITRWPPGERVYGR